MSQTFSMWRRVTGILVVCGLLCIAPAVQRAVRKAAQVNAPARIAPASANMFTLAFDRLDPGIVAMDPPSFRLGIYDEADSGSAKTTPVAVATTDKNAPATAPSADAEAPADGNPAYGVFNFPSQHAPQVLGLVPSEPSAGVYAWVPVPVVFMGGSWNAAGYSHILFGSFADPFDDGVDPMVIVKDPSRSVASSITSSVDTKHLVARPTRNDIRPNGVTPATPAVVPLPSAVWNGGIGLIFAAAAIWLGMRKKYAGQTI